MVQFFWQIHDDYNLARSSILVGINVLAFGFALNAFVRIKKIRDKLGFELLPLSINVIALFLLLIFKLFEWSFQFGEINSILEVFTYFLFCYAFGILYAEFCVKHRPILFRRILSLLLLINLTLCLLITVLILTQVISRTCQNYGFGLMLAGFIVQAAYYVPTIYFANAIVEQLRKNELQQVAQSKMQREWDGQVGRNSMSGQGVKKRKSSFSSSLNSDEYLRQRRKQIVLVGIVYTASIVIRLLMIILMWALSSTCLSCTQTNGTHILFAQNAGGQIVLGMSELSMILPHICIPMAIYLIPLRVKSNGEDVTLTFAIDQNLLDEEIGSEEFDHAAEIKNKILQSSTKSRYHTETAVSTGQSD